MRKTTCILMFMIAVIFGSAQMATTNEQPTASILKQQDYSIIQTGNRSNVAVVHFIPDPNYLKKSKTQKTFAWVLTGLGVTVVTITALTQGYVDAITGLTYEKNAASPIAYAIGGTCITGGIILFSAAARNKRKATTSAVSVKTGFILERSMTKINRKNFPAIGVSIGF